MLFRTWTVAGAARPAVPATTAVFAKKAARERQAPHSDRSQRGPGLGGHVEVRRYRAVVEEVADVVGPERPGLLHADLPGAVHVHRVLGDRHLARLRLVPESGDEPLLRRAPRVVRFAERGDDPLEQHRLQRLVLVRVGGDLGPACLEVFVHALRWDLALGRRNEPKELRDLRGLVELLGQDLARSRKDPRTLGVGNPQGLDLRRLPPQLDPARVRRVGRGERPIGDQDVPGLRVESRAREALVQPQVRERLGLPGLSSRPRSRPHRRRSRPRTKPSDSPRRTPEPASAWL